MCRKSNGTEDARSNRTLVETSCLVFVDAAQKKKNRRYQSTRSASASAPSPACPQRLYGMGFLLVSSSCDNGTKNRSTKPFSGGENALARPEKKNRTVCFELIQNANRNHTKMRLLRRRFDVADFGVRRADTIRHFVLHIEHDECECYSNVSPARRTSFNTGSISVLKSNRPKLQSINN